MFHPEQIEQLNNGDTIVVDGNMLAPPELASHVESGMVPETVTQTGAARLKSTNKAPKKKVAKDKAANVRNWLKIDQNGETCMIQADKYKLTHKLGVQGRDLRIMDPSLATTYPSAILCRDKAMVVNLEHIKVVITTNSVLVVNPEDENVLAFISELKMKLSQPGGLNVSASYPAALNDLGLPKGMVMRSANSRSNVKLEGLAALQMPFELKALEVCLDSVRTVMSTVPTCWDSARHISHQLTRQLGICHQIH
jgi:hypothetical protein